MWQLLPLLPFPPPPDPNACPETCPESQPLSGTCKVLTPHSLHPAQRSRPLPSWDRASHESRRTRGSAGVSLGLLRRQSRRQRRRLRWPCPMQQGRAIPCRALTHWGLSRWLAPPARAALPGRSSTASFLSAALAAAAHFLYILWIASVWGNGRSDGMCFAPCLQLQRQNVPWLVTVSRPACLPVPLTSSEPQAV